MDRSAPIPRLPPSLPQVYFPTRPISGFDDFDRAFKDHGLLDKSRVDFSLDEHRNGPREVAANGSLDDRLSRPLATAVTRTNLPHMHGNHSYRDTQAEPSSTDYDQRWWDFASRYPLSASSDLNYKQVAPTLATEYGLGEDDGYSLLPPRDAIVRKDFAYSKRSGKRPVRDLSVRGRRTIASQALYYQPQITRTSPTPRTTDFAGGVTGRSNSAIPAQSRDHLVVPSWKHARPFVVPDPLQRRGISEREPQSDLRNNKQARGSMQPASISDLSGSFTRLHYSTMAHGTSTAGPDEDLREIMSLDESRNSISRFSDDNDVERGKRKRKRAKDASRASMEAAVFRPDHSWSGWLQAICSPLVVMNCWGFNLCYGVFESYYKLTFLSGHTRSSIAWIGSVQLSLVFLSAIVVGRCYDAGTVRPFYHGGSIGIVAGIFGTSCCRTWSQLFWVQGVLTGTSMGCVFCSGVLVVMEYFDRKLGIAIAIGAAGSSIGGLIYTIMAQRLLPTAGFAWTIRYMGFFALGTLIPPNIVFKPRYTSSHRTEPKQKPSFSFLRDPSFLSMALGMFLSFWSLYFGFYYIVSYAYNVLGLSQNMSINLLLAMLAANLPGRFIPAFLSDACIGPLDTLVASCFITSIILFLWIGTTNTAGIFVLAALYGFASAGPQALFTPTIAVFFKRHSISGVDPAKGLKAAAVFVAIGVACATGPPLGGALIDHGAKAAPKHLPYLYGQLFAGCAMAGAAVCFLISRLCRVGCRATRA